MYKELIRQTTYMLNHYAVSALSSEPRGGRTWFIQNELCNQQLLAENNATAIVFDIQPSDDNKQPLLSQLIETLNKKVKDPVFMDVSFKLNTNFAMLLPPSPTHSCHQTYPTHSAKCSWAKPTILFREKP